MNFTILDFDILDSTNTEALRQAKAGAAEGLCVVARQQTAGRGRYGRTWVSTRDAGLYFSIVLRPKFKPKFLPLITLMAGNAVHDALKEFAIEPDIKWVNDVLVGERKIAGILAETTDTADGVAVVVGIGVNLKSTNFPPDLVATATSVEDNASEPVSRDDLVAVLTRHLGHFYDVLQNENGAAEIINTWRMRSSYYYGKLVRVAVEAETITGTTDGLEPNGALRIRRGDGTITVIQAGDVQRLRAD